MEENLVNIGMADYKTGLPNVAGKVNGYGSSFLGHINAAYEQISNLKTSWYGKRYNELVAIFNGEAGDGTSFSATGGENATGINPKEAFTNMINLLMYSIPSSIIQVANNYARVDGAPIIDDPYSGKALGAGGDEESITVIAKSDVEGKLRFVESEVNTTKEEVKNCFTSAKSILSDVDDLFANMQVEGADYAWTSNASALYKTTYEGVKADVETAFTNLLNAIDTVMETTKLDMKSAEDMNVGEVTGATPEA